MRGYVFAGPFRASALSGHAQRAYREPEYLCLQVCNMSRSGGSRGDRG